MYHKLCPKTHLVIGVVKDKVEHQYSDYDNNDCSTCQNVMGSAWTPHITFKVKCPFVWGHISYRKSYLHNW